MIGALRRKKPQPKPKQKIKPKHKEKGIFKGGGQC